MYGIYHDAAKQLIDINHRLAAVGRA